MVRSLDNLPVELLHKIFDNLSTVDIYFNVSLVNRRLREIALSYSQFQSGFAAIFREDIDRTGF